MGPGHGEKVSQSVCSLRVRIVDRCPNHRGEPSDLLSKQNGGKKKIKGLEGPTRHSPACTRPQAPPGHMGPKYHGGHLEEIKGQPRVLDTCKVPIPECSRGDWGVARDWREFVMSLWITVYCGILAG